MGTTKSINQFLREAKEGAGRDTMVVMGNEAADLDSMASAVVFAYYLASKGESAVPLMNIPRDDFNLRTEAVFLFREAGVDVDLMLFQEDIDLEERRRAGNLNLVLVDHNKLAASQEGLKGSVTRILDHHADEGLYSEHCETDIRPVGSAATIVAESFLADARESIDSSVGTLLLGTILLDTVNLDLEAGRVTEADEKAVGSLLEITGIDQGGLFDKLQFEKFNVSSLGSYDLLRKDYKEWQMGAVKCGIGSVLMPVPAWLKKDPDVVAACRSYLQERGLDVLIAMSAFTDPEFTRNLVVFVPDAKRREEVISFLEGAGLGLETIDSSGVKESSAAAFYNQTNLGISRKKLQPLLNDFFT